MAAPPIEVRARRGQPLGMPPARFLRDYWQKRPLLIRRAFPDFTPPLTPDDLAGLACMDGALARIVLRGDGKTKSLGSGFRAARDPGMTTKGNASFPRKRDGKGRACPGLDPGIANANAEGGPKGERQGRRESIHLALPPKEKMDSRFRGNDGKRKGTPTSTNDVKWKVLTGPFNDATFAKLPDHDWTLLVQDVDKWDAATAALLDHFDFIPSWRIDDVMVSYAAEGGGVGAHVDQYDVFLLQGVGKRRWAIDTRQNPPIAFRDDVELKLLHTFHPTHEWVLEPGDMLYLPPGVPHDGVAIGECTTFSIGMRAPAAGELLFDFAAHVAESLPESQRFADPDLTPATVAGEIDDAALARVVRAMPWVRFGGEGKKQEHAGGFPGFARKVPASMLRTWFGCFITRYRAAQVPVPRKHPIDHATLADRLPRATLERDPWSRFAWCRNGRNATLFVAGSAFDAPVAWARELASGARTFDGARLSRLSQPARGIELLAKLTNAGHVRFRRR